MSGDLPEPSNHWLENSFQLLLHHKSKWRNARSTVQGYGMIPWNISESCSMHGGGQSRRRSTLRFGKLWSQDEDLQKSKHFWQHLSGYIHLGTSPRHRATCESIQAYFKLIKIDLSSEHGSSNSRQVWLAGQCGSLQEVPTTLTIYQLGVHASGMHFVLQRACQRKAQTCE